MPKKPAKLRPDMNEVAYRTMLAATGQGPKPTPPGEGEKNPEAVERGRRGGRIGGKVRAAKLTKARKAEIATRAANARHRKRS